jgi:hypothetical protein
MVGSGVLGLVAQMSDIGCAMQVNALLMVASTAYFGARATEPLRG